MPRLKRIGRKVIRRVKRDLSDPATLASLPGGPASYAGRKIAGGVKRDVYTAVRHPSPSSISHAGLSVASVAPGLGAARASKVARTPGFTRSAEEVFRSRSGRTAATRATRLRSVEIPAARARAGAVASRGAEVARESAAKTIRAIRAGSPSSVTLSRSAAAGATIGLSAHLKRKGAKRSDRPATFHPLKAEESPAEGLRKVAEVSKTFGPAGTRALIEGQRAAREATYAPGNRGMSSSQKTTTLRLAVGAAFARNLKDERRKMDRASALRITRQ